MPVIEVSLPSSLLRDLSFLAEYNDIDRETFILWALAEKIGELKGEIFNRAMQESVGKVEPLIQRYPKIKRMLTHDNFIVHFEFESGLVCTFDLKPLIERLGKLNTLSEPGVYKTLKFSSDSNTIQWANPVTKEATIISAEILLDEMFHHREENANKEEDWLDTTDK